MTFAFKSRTKNLLFKYNNFNEFCFYIINKTPNLNPSSRPMWYDEKPYGFDVRTTIKMNVKDIKAKFMKIVIFIK